MTNKQKIISYFLYGIECRDNNKNKSSQVGISIFNGSLFFDFSENPELEKIRYEFGALEHIGWSEDINESQNEYEERLWRRLEIMISNLK